MFSIGKTVYLLHEGTYIYCDDSAITFKLADGRKQSLAYHVVSEIIIFYNTTLSVYLMKMCTEHHIIIHYVSPYGRYIGCFLGDYSGNVVLRKKQFEMLNELDKSLDYVRNLLCAKFKNSIWTLQYFHHIKDNTAVKPVIKELRNDVLLLRDMTSVNDMRLLEANAANSYFSVFDDLLKISDADMQFAKRSRRPPLNNVNALLSLFYTLATSIADSALICRGLDSECGYLHVLRSGRRSLACDLVEEFRSCVVDRFVIAIINRKEVVSSDFRHDNDGIRLSDDAKKRLFSKWEQYLDDTEVTHMLYDKKLSLRCLFYEQALLLAQYIRGDISVYPPFFMK